MDITMTEPAQITRILVTGPFSVEESSLLLRLRYNKELTTRTCCGINSYSTDWDCENVILVNLRDEILNSEYNNIYEKMVERTISNDVTKFEPAELLQTIISNIQKFENTNLKTKSGKYLFIYFGLLLTDSLFENFFNQQVYFFPPISSLLANYYLTIANNYYKESIQSEHTRYILYCGPKKTQEEKYGEYPKEIEASKKCRVLSNVEIINVYNSMISQLTTHKDPLIFTFGSEVVNHLTCYIKQNFKKN